MTLVAYTHECINISIHVLIHIHPIPHYPKHHAPLPTTPPPYTPRMYVYVHACLYIYIYIYVHILTFLCGFRAYPSTKQGEGRETGRTTTAPRKKTPPRKETPPRKTTMARIPLRRTTTPPIPQRFTFSLHNTFEMLHFHFLRVALYFKNDTFLLLQKSNHV